MRRVTIAMALAAGTALVVAPFAVAAPPESATVSVREAVPAIPAGCIVPMQPVQIHDIPRGGPRLGHPMAPVIPVMPVGMLC